MNNRTISTRLLTRVVACCLGVACEPTAQQHQTVLRDSAGVLIVENATESDVNALQWQISSQPVLTIGDGSQPEEQFFRIVSTFRMSDGRIAVANAGSLELRFFDERGRFLSTVGRPGDGPGEFRSLYGMYRLPAESIAVYDTQLQRMTVFDHDGTFVRSFSTMPPAGASRVVPAGPLSDTGWLMMFSQSVATVGPGDVRLALYLGLYDQTGTFLDTAAVLPGVEVFVHQVPQGRVVPSVPFGRGAAVTTTGTGYLVTLSDSFEVRKYDSQGHLSTIIRKAVDARPVTPADVAAARNLQFDVVRDPRQQSLISDAYESMSIPATMPAVGALVLERLPWIASSSAGGFWVLNFKAPLDSWTTWSVFESDGQFSGTVTLPDRFALFDLGAHYALGVSRDSLDVERVVMYEVTQP